MMYSIDALPYAIAAANQSPCRSKRGAVVFSHRILSVGFNSPPYLFLCDGSEKCNRTCRRTAVHAEQRAILAVSEHDRGGASILHVKTVNGLPVPSGPPSCLECSKLILESRILRVWLLHDDGWKSYPSEEFHRLTLQHEDEVTAPFNLSDSEMAKEWDRET